MHTITMQIISSGKNKSMRLCVNLSKNTVLSMRMKRNLYHPSWRDQYGKKYKESPSNHYLFHELWLKIYFERIYWRIIMNICISINWSILMICSFILMSFSGSEKIFYRHGRESFSTSLLMSFRTLTRYSLILLKCLQHRKIICLSWEMMTSPSIVSVGKTGAYAAF